MRCLSEKTIESLVTGFLDRQARIDALEHLRRCAKCRDLVRKTITLYRGLSGVFARESREDCSGGAELADYQQGRLNSADNERIEKHLKHCVRCAADLYDLRIESTISLETPESVFKIYQSAADKDPINKWFKHAIQQNFNYPETIKLPAFIPKTEQSLRLAAATGSGFEKQNLTQKQLPFDIEISQFGQECRITLKLKENLHDYANCLVRLIFCEGKSERLAKPVLVKNGAGKCLLSPDEVDACVPEENPLTINIETVSIDKLHKKTKDPAIIEALIKLLRHFDAQVRLSAINLLAETDSKQVLRAIAELKKHPDPLVRAAAQKALKQLGK